MLNLGPGRAVYYQNILINLFVINSFSSSYFLIICTFDAYFNINFTSQMLLWQNGHICNILTIVSTAHFLIEIVSASLMVLVRYLGLVYPLQRHLQHNILTVNEWF